MLKIIAAHDPNRLIGKKDKMPWHISEEFELFRKKTIGSTIVLGLPTVKGMGRLLPKRETIILSKNGETFDNAKVFSNIDEIIEFGKKQDIWIGGGAKVFELFFPYVDELHISILKKEYEGDVYFPNYSKEWKIKESTEYEEFRHIIFIRK